MVDPPIIFQLDKYLEMFSANCLVEASASVVLSPSSSSSRVAVSLEGRGTRGTMVSGSFFLWERSTRLIKKMGQQKLYVMYLYLV